MLLKETEINAIYDLQEAETKVVASKTDPDGLNRICQYNGKMCNAWCGNGGCGNGVGTGGLRGQLLFCCTLCHIDLTGLSKSVFYC